MSQKTHSKIYIIFIITVLAWGLSWPVNKMGLAYMPPIWFAASRLCIGSLASFILVASIRQFVIPSFRDIPLILVIGLFQMGFFILFINLGMTYVEAGRSAILAYTTPFWVMPIAIIFFKEKSSLLKWIGFTSGMLGVVILFSPWSIDWTQINLLIGNGFLLLAALCFAVSILSIRNMQWHHTPLQLLPWQLLVAAIPITLLALYKYPHPEINWTNTLIMCISYTAVIATAFGFWGATLISKELPSITVSLGLLGVPISGLLFSTLLLHEAITIPIILALIFIPLGLICVTLSKNSPS